MYQVQLLHGMRYICCPHRAKTTEQSPLLSSYTKISRCQTRIQTHSCHLRPKNIHPTPARPNSHSHMKSTAHSFAPLALLASLSRSLNSRLKIFPLGLFGITSINSIP